MSMVQQVLSAIQARPGLIVVRTTDEATVAAEIAEVLPRAGHVLLEWAPVLGSRTSQIDDVESRPFLIHEGGWDLASTDSPFPLLQGWLTAILGDEPEKVIYHCLGCSSVVEAPASAATSMRAATCTSQKCDGKLSRNPDGSLRRAHRTLVLRGVSHNITEGGPQYDPHVVRALWDIAQVSYRRPVNLMLILPAETALPADLSREAAVIDDPLPTRAEIRDVVWPEFVRDREDESSPYRRVLPEGDVATSQETSSHVADRLCGLSRPEVMLAMQRSLIAGGEARAEGKDGWHAFLAGLQRAKEALISKTGALEIMQPVPMKDVGGLGNLRKWVEVRRHALTPDAEAKGIPRPRGVIMTGVSGGGKSWAAKAIGGALDLPIVRLKVGAVFNKWVGDSEKGIREALRVLDAMAPCVGFIDEIEKAFAGAGGSSDGGSGVTLRVFGELLTWMQERQGEPVFLVGAANRIDGIPPEFTRAGRFDAVFFVDLPTWSERDEILRVHLRKAGVDCTSWAGPTWDDLLKRTIGFVGAEIEGVLTDARINAHAANEDLRPDHIIASIHTAPPLAVTRKQDVDNLRKWAAEHGLRRASEPENEPTQSQDPQTTFGGGIGIRSRRTMQN